MQGVGPSQERPGQVEAAAARHHPHQAAVQAVRPAVEMPASKLKVHLAEVLRDEGYILGFQTGKYVKSAEGKQFDVNAPMTAAGVTLRVYLKYGPEGEQVIQHLERVSRPGLRR